MLKHVRRPLRGSLVDAVKWLNLRCRSGYTQSLSIFVTDIVLQKRGFGVGLSDISNLAFPRYLRGDPIGVDGHV